MIEQIELFKNNVLALEVIDGFTEADEQFGQKLFQQKLDEGFETVNVLIKLDEMKVSHSSTKAFMEDAIWGIRQYKNLGNIAIVAHSNIVKALIPIDAFFFERLRKGYEERYFDISQMDKAITFVTSKN